MSAFQRSRASRKFSTVWILLAVAVLTSAAVQPASAQESDESTAYSAVTGVGAALCTIVYAPLKVGYAVGGVVISGLAWAWTLGDTSIAGPILRSAVQGDYMVTPAHLEGYRELEFIGPQY